MNEDNSNSRHPKDSNPRYGVDYKIKRTKTNETAPWPSPPTCLRDACWASSLSLCFSCTKTAHSRPAPECTLNAACASLAARCQSFARISSKTLSRNTCKRNEYGCMSERGIMYIHSGGSMGGGCMVNPSTQARRSRLQWALVSLLTGRPSRAAKDICVVRFRCAHHHRFPRTRIRMFLHSAP